MVNGVPGENAAHNRLEMLKGHGTIGRVEGRLVPLFA